MEVGKVSGAGAQANSGTGVALRAIGDELSDMFYERSDVVRAVLVAMLAAKHSLVLGPPGTAKSELARELTSRITGAHMWEILLSKFTDPKKMFGPVDVAALTQGRYTQVFEGRATTCHIAFMDEIFKCSVGALNETLSFLNERLYHPENGGAPIPCPLISAITASNELPSGEESAAIYDRLLVRLEVGYLSDPGNFAKLVRSAVVDTTPSQRTTVDLAELQHAVTVAVPAIDVPDGIVDIVCQLRSVLRKHELVASDRRWKQSIRLLQASAYLDGRGAVSEDDLTVLSHSLWESTAERPTVERQVLALVDPDAHEALDLLDAVNEIEGQLDAKAGQSREALSEWAIKEANRKLGKAGKRLEELRRNAEAAGRSTSSLDRALGRQRAVYTRVMVDALGMDVSSLAANS